MSDVAAIISDLVKAGVDPELVGRTAAALARREPVLVPDEQAERRRARDRERKRLRNSAESAETVLPPEQKVPRPLKTQPLTQTPPSPPKGGSSPQGVVVSFGQADLEILAPETGHSRQADLRRRPTQADFDGVFWPAYPHKVGKHAAASAWAKVLRRDDVWLDQISVALRRYVEAKPPDRPWCNPATWLNQGRWTDEPSDDPESSRQNRAYPAHRQSGSGAHGQLLAAVAETFGVGRERRADDDDPRGDGAYFGAAYRN